MITYITVRFLCTKDPKANQYLNKTVCDIHKYIHDTPSTALGGNYPLV